MPTGRACSWFLAMAPPRRRSKSAKPATGRCYRPRRWNARRMCASRPSARSTPWADDRLHVPPSKRQANDEPGSDDANEKVPESPATVPVGPVAIVVFRSRRVSPGVALARARPRRLRHRLSGRDGYGVRGRGGVRVLGRGRCRFRGHHISWASASAASSCYVVAAPVIRPVAIGIRPTWVRMQPQNLDAVARPSRSVSTRRSLVRDRLSSYPSRSLSPSVSARRGSVRKTWTSRRLLSPSRSRSWSRASLTAGMDTPEADTANAMSEQTDARFARRFFMRLPWAARSSVRPRSAPIHELDGTG